MKRPLWSKWAVLASMVFLLGSIGPLRAHVIPQDSEFLVNSYSNNNQWYPCVATDTSGNFVVAWESEGEDGNGYGVYAQRYDAAGVAQGSEFQANSYTNGDQWAACVAMDADGDFVVAWSSSGQDGSGDGVYAQRYDAAGVPQGSEFRVNSYTNDNQWYPCAAMDTSGNFVVAWESNGQDGDFYGVYAQRYNPAGVAQGSEFQVNSETFDNQWFSSVGMDADGDFVIAWESMLQDGDESGVYARRYNAAGVSQGGEFRVNTYTAAGQRSPSVAMHRDGDFVTAWESYGQDGGGYGIYARRFSRIIDHDRGMTNAVAGADADKDGQSNLEEYLAGTDPRDRDSVFAISALTIESASDFVIEWKSVTGKYYALKKCTNLVTGSWDVVTNNISATEPMNTVTVEVSAADALFYRVELEQ